MFEFALGLGQKSGRLIRRFSVPFSSPDQAALLHFFVCFFEQSPRQHGLIETFCKKNHANRAVTALRRAILRDLSYKTLNFKGFFDFYMKHRSK